MHGYPVRYCVLDTETVSERNESDPLVRELSLRLGVVKIYDPTCPSVSCPEWFEFTRVDRFWDWLSIIPYNNEPIYIFAHNMGFDARIIGLFRAISQGKLTLDPPADWPRAHYYKKPLCIIESPPFIVRTFRSDGQSFIWLDTVQWWACKLEVLGDSIGYPKGTMPGEDAPESDWMDYCRRDVDILDCSLRKLWSWLESIHCHAFHYTRAGQAMHIWRTRYGAKKITPPKDPSALWMDRHAYYGGRLIVARVGDIDGPVYKVDVNSMYPYVMRNSVYPVKLVATGGDAEPQRPETLPHPLAHTVECYLESPSVPYPVRCSDGVHWCTGRVRTILCGPEYRRAVEQGHVRQIGRWNYYEMLGLFRAFVDCFHNARLEARTRGDMATDLLCKLILNSLYGKFGQRTGQWVDVGQVMATDRYCSGRIVKDSRKTDMEFRVLAGREQIRRMDEEDRTSFVPISAYVASYGRVLMDEFREQLPQGEVYYQATDSLLIGYNAYQWFRGNGLLDPDRLGSWKEDGPWDQITIYGVGTIDLGETRQRMGIKGDAIEISPEVWQVDEWESAPTTIFRGKVDSVGITKRLKAGTPRTPPMMVDRAGWTIPPSINNWEIAPEHQAQRPLRRGSRRTR